MTTTLRRPRRLVRTATPAADLTAPGVVPSDGRRGEARGRLRVLRGAALGAASGIAWGVAARVWMRLVATDPSFSWSGTLLILGVATLAGALLGVALAGRDGRFRRLARTVGAVSILPLGVGAGVVVLPAVIAAVLAAPGRLPRLPGRLLGAGLPCVAILAIGLDGSTLRWVAVGLVAFVGLGAVARTFRPLMAVYAAAAVGLVVVPMFDGSRSVVRAVSASVLYVVLLLPPAWAYHRAVRRRDATGTPPDQAGQHDPSEGYNPFDPPATVGGTAPSEGIA